MVDIIILLVIAILLILAFRFYRKKGGCAGCESDCSSCKVDIKAEYFKDHPKSK